MKALRNGLEATLKSFGGGGLGPFFNRIPVLGGDEEKLRKPFAESVWVQRAIKKVSGPISAVSLCFRDPESEQEIEGEAWLDFWKAPAKGLSRGDLIEAMVGWLKLAGEDFILLTDEFGAPFPDRVTKYNPFLLARPDTMTPVMAGAEVTGWRLLDKQGQQLHLNKEQVVQPKFWNPYDDVRGMSEYEAARVATEADYLSGKFALHLAASNGDQGVYISMKGSPASDEQREQIANQLRMKRAMQQRGQFVPMFINGDMEVQDPKIRAVDAGFVAQRLENRHEIFIALGVPPSMADVTASYSIGSASDRYMLIEETCIPVGCKIGEAFSDIASRQAGRRVEAYFDWDEHPVMQAVRRERIDTGVKLWGCGMPMRSVSDYLDLDLPEFEGDDVALLPFSVAPVGATKEPSEDPKMGESDQGEGDGFAQVRRALKGFRNGRLQIANGKAGNRFEILLPGFIEECCCPVHNGFTDLQISKFAKADIAETAQFQKSRAPREAHAWRYYMSKRLPTIQAYQKNIGKLVSDACAEVLRKLQTPNSKLQGSSGAVTKAAAADLMFDLDGFAARFTNVMRGLSAQALVTAGQQLFDEVKRDDVFSMPPAKALEFLEQRENRLSGVPDEIFDRIKDSLSDGLEKGESTRELRDRVKAERTGISDKRATTIAMTETGAAYGTATHEAMEQAGIRAKRWLTSNNNNVRAAHRLMNGQTIAIDRKFVVVNPKTGEFDAVLHPGDADGAPWNVINCHCVEVPAVEPSKGEAE